MTFTFVAAIFFDSLLWCIDARYKPLCPKTYREVNHDSQQKNITHLAIHSVRCCYYLSQYKSAHCQNLFSFWMDLKRSVCVFRSLQPLICTSDRLRLLQMVYKTHTDQSTYCSFSQNFSIWWKSQLIVIQVTGHNQSKGVAALSAKPAVMRRKSWD